MPVNAITCPRCQSNHVVKNGRIHTGQQNFKCKGCSRQFVQNLTKKVIEQETRDLIDKLLLERLSLAGIARATGVSEKRFINKTLSLLVCSGATIVAKTTQH